MLSQYRMLYRYTIHSVRYPRMYTAITLRINCKTKLFTVSLTRAMINCKTKHLTMVYNAPMAQTRDKEKQMNRAEIKRIRAIAQKAIEDAQRADLFGYVSALQSAFAAHKCKTITAPEYKAQVLNLVGAINRTIADTPQDDAVEINAAPLANSAFSRKVSPTGKRYDGLQTIRTGSRIEIREDIAGNKVVQETPLVRSVKPEKLPVITGSKARKRYAAYLARIETVNAEREREREEKLQNKARIAERAADKVSAQDTAQREYEYRRAFRLGGRLNQRDG